jgi:SAM-dependent methyltransferase
MSEERSRPFYSDYAWAFDLIIDRPVRRDCAAIVSWLSERGIQPGAQLLDAGCGTGRYSVALARQGYVVHGVDASADLIDVANQSVHEARGSLSFAVGDILEEPPGRYDAILCRGVLNDFIGDVARALVIGAFFRALRPGGVLILDVREWETSAERKVREPVFRKSVDTERGQLTFTSITKLDREKRLLLSSERHALIVDGQERASYCRNCSRPAPTCMCRRRTMTVR